MHKLHCTARIKRLCTYWYMCISSTTHVAQSVILISLLSLSLLHMLLQPTKQESRPALVNKLVDVTDRTYTREQIVQMEMLLTSALDWNLYPATPLHWLNLFLSLYSTSTLISRYSNLGEHSSSIPDDALAISCETQRQIFLKCIHLIDIALLDYNWYPKHFLIPKWVLAFFDPNRAFFFFFLNISTSAYNLRPAP